RSQPMGWHSKPVRWCWRDLSSARSRPARATRSRPTMDLTARGAVTSRKTRRKRKRGGNALPPFPHEKTANLDERVDMADVVEVVRRAAVETGIFPVGGIRVRAIKCEHYAIGDGNPQLSFLPMVLRLGEGRDLAARKKAGEHIFTALLAYLDPGFASSKFALSFDMQINDKETSWKRNNIHDALKVEAAHG